MLLAIVVVCAVLVTGVLPQLPEPVWFVGSVLGWLLAGAGLYRQVPTPSPWQVRCWGLSGVFVVVCAWATLWGQSRLDDRLHQELEGQALLLRGRVVGLPAPFDYGANRSGSRLLLEPDHACLLVAQSCPEPPVRVPRRVRINWYGDLPPASGELWQLSVKLKRPHGFQNPGGFDYERWLLSRSIGATGYVRASPLNRQLQPSDWWSVDHWRHQLRSRLLVAATDSGSTAGVGLALALLLGDKSYLEEDQRQRFQALGLAHLLAISGLHIGLAASVGALLGAVAGRCLGLCFPGRVFTPRLILIAAWLMALLYAALAGFSLPTQRALVMLTVWVGLVWLGMGASPWLGWWLAMALVLVLQPLGFYDLGFWLSFAAVAVLIACFGADFGGRQALWIGFLRAQWVLLVGVGLLQWYAGLSISLIAPLANAVAIPLVGLVVTPLLFLVALAFAVSEPLFAVVAELALWLLEHFGSLLEHGYLLLQRCQDMWLWRSASSVGYWGMLLALVGLMLWMLPMPGSF